jgi:hypothetical protein
MNLGLQHIGVSLEVHSFSQMYTSSVESYTLAACLTATDHVANKVPSLKSASAAG